MPLSNEVLAFHVELESKLLNGRPVAGNLRGMCIAILKACRAEWGCGMWTPTVDLSGRVMRALVDNDGSFTIVVTLCVDRTFDVDCFPGRWTK